MTAAEREYSAPLQAATARAEEAEKELAELKARFHLEPGEQWMKLGVPVEGRFAPLLDLDELWLMGLLTDEELRDEKAKQAQTAAAEEKS